jgi:hypothetical protein
MSGDHNQYQKSTSEERVAISDNQRHEWVNLTDEDMQAMFLNDEGIRIARYIEARIKEKNGVLADDVLA